MSRSFVVRLRDDARARGQIVGEVEEVDSRRVAGVRDGAELLAFILDDDAIDAPRTSEAAGGTP